MDLAFIHVFQPPATPTAPVLLLLHGTGGSEEDLVPLGGTLAPQAGILSPRGQVLERGMPRFFRRLAEGVFDIEDLHRRTGELGDFVLEARRSYKIESHPIVAVGFSNGANIASSLLLSRPSLLAAAVLIKAMVPFVPDPLPALAGTPVLISNGEDDPLVAREETERLAALLGAAGAAVTLAWQPGGHQLATADVTTARQWLQTALR